MKKLYFSREEKLAARRALRKLKPEEWHERNRILGKESRVRHRDRCNARAADYRKRMTLAGETKEKRDAKANPQLYLWRAARNRARQSGIEFSIQPEDIIIPEYCPIRNTKLLEVRQPHGERDDSPSVDRIDNFRGYVKNNIRVISYRANRCKSDLSIEHIKNLYQYILEYEEILKKENDEITKEV